VPVTGPLARRLTRTLTREITRGEGSGQPLKIAGIGGEIPQATAAAGNSSQVRIETDNYMKLGRAQRTLALAVCNYSLSGTRVETATGNAVVVRAHLRIDSAPTPVVVLTWDIGQASHSMASGESLALSDEVSAAAFGLAQFDAGTVVMARVSMTVANVAEVIPTTTSKYTTEESVRGPNTSTQIGSAGSLTVPGGWAAITSKVGPAALLGRAVGTPLGAIFFGDSIPNGFGDNVGYGNAGGGVYVRGAYDIGSGVVFPWARQAKTGTTAQQAVANFTKQSDLWAYATHFICNLGTNDAGAGRTAAQAYADLQTIWAAARAKGVRHVTQQRIMARASSSSDSWATVPNETITTAYQTGGTFRDPLNTSIGGSSNLNAVLNLDPHWSDGTLNDHIVMTGVAGATTTDGIHSTPARAALIAPDVASFLAGLT
jgi:lysophospholipase L1-like esterase